MSEHMSIRAAIEPKSDRLNADDLIAGPITITVTKATLVAGDQPLIINYEGDNGKPYRPGKSMARVIVFCWGEEYWNWSGSMTLYRDPTVRFGPEQVGGIRISHISGIDRTMKVSLTVTRGKKAPYTVEPLQLAQEPEKPTMYPPEKFSANKPKWQELVTSGKKTPDQIIAQVQKSGQLTDEQLSEIRGWTVAEPEPASEEDDELFD